MDTNFVEELRKQTKEVNDRKKVEREKAEAIMKSSQEEKDKAIAESVMDFLPEACKVKADEGVNKVRVYTEHKQWSYTFFLNGTKKPKITGGPGVIVVEKCKALGFEVDVAIRCNPEGRGTEYAEIWVSW